MKYLLGMEYDIVKRTSKIAKHSVVSEEADSGKLLDIHMCWPGIKKHNQQIVRKHNLLCILRYNWENYKNMFKKKLLTIVADRIFRDLKH